MGFACRGLLGLDRLVLFCFVFFFFFFKILFKIFFWVFFFFLGLKVEQITDKFFFFKFDGVTNF